MRIVANDIRYRFSGTSIRARMFACKRLLSSKLHKGFCISKTLLSHLKEKGTMYGKKGSTSTENSSICVHCYSQYHQTDNCPFMPKTTKKMNFQKKDQTKTVKVNKHKNDKVEKEENEIEPHFFVISNVDSPKKIKKCNFCEENDHVESNCLKKVQHLYDVKNKSKFCSFCGANDHCEENCSQKSQIEYNINYCNLCNNYGHCNCSKNSVEIDHKSHTYENKTIKSSEKENLVQKGSIKFNDCPKSLSNELRSIENENSKRVQKCSYCFSYGHSENYCLSLLKNLKKKQNEEINSDENQSLDMLQKKFENLEMLKSYKEANQDHSKNTRLDLIQRVQTPAANHRDKEQENEKRLEGFQGIKYCKICDETGHSQTECYSKLYTDYYSKHCNYCNSNGHIEDFCPLYAKFTEKIDHSTFYSSKKKQNCRKQENSQDFKKCTFCGETGHTESGCFVKEKTIYYSQHCDHCNDDGHLKNTCPFLIKSEDRIQETTNCNYKKKADGINLEVCQDLEYCIYCDKFGHTEAICLVKEQSIYYSKHCDYCNDDGHTKDICPQILESTEKMQKIKDWCDKTRESSIKILKQCTCCKEMGHIEEDCFVKEQSIFYSKHCDYCNEDGHFEDMCPIFLENTETNSVTHKKFCTFCGEIDHNEADCSVKENYDKYCNYCKDFGHTEGTCTAGFKIVKNNKSKSQTKGNSYK